MCLFEFVVVLKAHPKLLGGAKIASPAYGRIRRDGPLAEHDLVDTARGNVDIPGESVLADPERNQELFQQDLAGMDVWKFVGHIRSYHLVGRRRGARENRREGAPPT